MKQYVIKKGETFVAFDNHHRITLTTRIENASKFDWTRANTIIRTQIKKRERNLYFIEEIEVSNDSLNAIANEQDNLDTINMQDVFDNFQDYFQGIQKILPHINKCKEEFLNRLSDVDTRQSDLLHRIEMPKDNGKEFNASEMYKLCSQLRDVRRERRVIKSNLRRINLLLSSVTQFDCETFNNGLPSIDEPVYNPRILKELFE